MRLTTWLLFLVLTCSLAAPSASAKGGGGVDGDWEVGVFYGRGFPDSYGGVNPDDAGLWGLRVGWFSTPRWSFEGSWQTISSEGGQAGNPDVDLNSLRGNVLFNMRAGHKFRWFLTAGAGLESLEADALGVDEEELGWNGGGGARWYFGKSRHLGLRADARWVSADSQNNYETTGGVLWSFGGGPSQDSDKDHVADGKDKCAHTPSGASVDSTGCPKDSDADRVYDGIDKCAGTPAGWAVDATGCPADADGDGVADVQDKCAGTPAGIKANAEGCPVEDADGDGAWDGADRCPETPKGTAVDPVGCPMDSDQDGVWDGADKCPGTPKGSKVDSSGCVI